MKLLDLFCGAGGCSVGYNRAGFDVVGVDIEPHADYPFELILADAVKVATDTAFLSQFDVVHASPPCPRYSVATKATGTSDNHPDLVPVMRDLLNAWGGIWVMENVPGAPMPTAVTICGKAMGLQWIKRHRLFESNVLLFSPGCACDNRGTVSVFGHSGEDRRKSAGGVRKHVPIAEVRDLMGVPWMRSRDDIADAIPPAYTEYLGHQLAAHVEAARQEATTK